MLLKITKDTNKLRNPATLHYGFHKTPFGECLIVLSPHGICHLSFANGSTRTEWKKSVMKEWPKASSWAEDSMMTAMTVEEIFCAGNGGRKELKLHLSGTGFQLKVWEALLEVPYGTIISYGELAKNVGKPSASRAVGTAVGKNAVSFLIPCHRVIRANGEIGNYRWGRDTKEAMLLWESKSFAERQHIA